MVQKTSAADMAKRLAALSPAKRVLLEARLSRLVKSQTKTKQTANIVQLQVGSTEVAVYFIHAGPFEIDLAHGIGPGSPIFGVDFGWPLSWQQAAAENNLAALPTLKQLVAPFVDALSAHARSKPYVLAGYSFGGLMAFEAARQLRELGGNVELVILLDTWGKKPAFITQKVADLKWVWKNTRDKQQGSPTSTARRLWRMGCWFQAKLAKWLSHNFAGLVSPTRHEVTIFDDRLTEFIDELSNPVPWELVERMYANARRSYQFRPLDTRAVIFRATIHNRRTDDENLGWGDLFTGGLEIISVTGDHHTIMRAKSNNLELVGKLRDVIRRYSRKEGRTTTISSRREMSV